MGTSLPYVISTTGPTSNKPQEWSSSSLSLLPSLSPPWLKTRRVVLNLMLMLKLEPDILAMDTDTMDTQSWEVDITTPTMAMPMLATHTTPDMVDTDLMDLTDMDVSSETERTRFCQQKKILNNVLKKQKIPKE